MNTLGGRIRTLRTSKGLSQTELGTGICTASAISQIENDKIQATDSLVKMIAARLDTSYEYLIFGTHLFPEGSPLKQTENVGQRIRLLRTIKGMSQAELGQGIVCATAIGQYENGKILPSQPVVQLLAKRLQVPYQHLAYGKMELMLFWKGDDVTYEYHITAWTGTDR